MFLNSSQQMSIAGMELFDPVLSNDSRVICVLVTGGRGSHDPHLPERTSG